MTKYIIDKWTSGNMVDEHSCIIVSTLEKAKDKAFEYMKSMFEDVGVDDYTREDFDAGCAPDFGDALSWIDEEEHEFGVNVIAAEEE